jgi:hypothetical protein
MPPAAKYSIENLRRIARERGGECLSDDCRGARRRARFRCAKGHEWETTAAMVAYQGAWCIRCARMSTLDEMHALAKKRRGRCLAKTYEGSRVKLEWLCAAGHRFLSAPNTVKGGSWCPRCARG